MTPYKSGCFQKINHKILTVKADVAKFFGMSSGKKYYIKAKDEVKQKCMLRDTLQILHKKSLATLYRIFLRASKI